MALTELQQMSKLDFYNTLRGSAGELIRIMLKFELLYKAIDKIEISDLDNMGVAAGQVRTDLQDYRNVVSEFVSLWNNNSITPVKDPQAVIDKIRRMAIF